MSKRQKPDGHFEFRVNYKFNSELQDYWLRNRHRFPTDPAAAKQYLFEVGLHRAADQAGHAPRTLERRREFLDPRRKSVSITLTDALREVLTVVCANLGIDQLSAASVVLRIGYDVEAVV